MTVLVFVVSHFFLLEVMNNSWHQLYFGGKAVE